MQQNIKIAILVLIMMTFSALLSYLLMQGSAKLSPGGEMAVKKPSEVVVKTPVEESIKTPEPAAPDPVAIDDGGEIYPIQAIGYNGQSLEYCVSSADVRYSATGRVDGRYANWFNWGGCARSRAYDVDAGKNIRFKITTDSCAGCVCTNPDFCVYEYYDGGWVQNECLELSEGKGLERSYYFTPKSSRIMVSSDSCFYLNLYYAD